jgi:hypothetical protein
VVVGPVRAVPELEGAVATWQGHMGARRLRLYGAPCRAVGFGFCDASFPAVFTRFGGGPFPAYRAPGGDDWYVDPGNVPGLAAGRGAAAAPSLSSAQAQMGEAGCVVVSGAARPGVSLAGVTVRVDDGEPEGALLGAAGWAFHRCGLDRAPEHLRVTARDALVPPREETLDLRFRPEP